MAGLLEQLAGMYDEELPPYLNPDNMAGFLKETAEGFGMQDTGSNIVNAGEYAMEDPGNALGILQDVFTEMHPADKAALVTSPVPFLGAAVGTAADARMYAEEPEQRTPFNAALTGLGMIPGAKMVAGTLAGLGTAGGLMAKANRAPDVPTRESQIGAIDPFDPDGPEPGAGVLGDLEADPGPVQPVNTGSLVANEPISKQDFTYNDNVPAVDPNSRSIVEVGHEFNAISQAKFDGPMKYTPENRAIVAGNMLGEVKAALKNRPAAAGWYKSNLEEAIQTASSKYPELGAGANDLTARDGFTFIMAITSNGQKVSLNARLTDDYYQHFRQTGRFLVAGSGKEQGAMKSAFTLANHMLDDMGAEDFGRFLDTDFTVRELIDAGYKVGGENMDTVMKGSVIFGPKIGGGFMQNLRGNFDVPTFDRWWQRTWGRHTGTLIASPKKMAKQRTAFRQALGNRKAMVQKLYGVDLADVKIKRGMDADEIQAADDALDALAHQMHGVFGRGNFKDKSPWNNASRNLDKSVSNVVDAPRGGGERTYMREAVRDVQSRLADEGTELDMADVQALLWYFEKDLYNKSGARATAEGVDYASAWKDFVGG